MSNDEVKRLYRSRNDKLIGGVCAGLADYFKVDPTIMRLLYILLCFVSLGSGVLIYLVLWVIVPESKVYKVQHQDKDNQDSHHSDK
ncbi:MAG: PspC domain-containing protein [Coxiellaceae bacterium]|nr:PspC domain-containing protein [Coxiellaceae bacterium]